MLVGREEERRLLEEALAGGEPPFAVLYVFGIGGCGKTALLREFAYLCEEAGTRALYLDAHRLTEPPLPLLLERARPGRRVILLDGCERLPPLQEWVDEDLLLGLQEGLLLVLSGRSPPPAEWLADPGWRSLVRLLPLGNLGEQESRELLARRGLHPRQQRGVLGFARGHPLALSLAADAALRNPLGRFGPEEEIEVVGTLAGHLVGELPGPEHREALEVCALSRHTTESLLARAVPGAEPGELFGWLRGLSFVRPGPLGLVPHPTAREVLAADLRWRDPDRHARLLRRVRRYHVARLGESRGAERQRALLDYLFLHREDPEVRPLLGRGEADGASAGPPRPGDSARLEKAVERHEGPASGRLARRLLSRGSLEVAIYRDPAGRPAGFAASLRLRRAGGEERDPAALAALRHLEGRGPLRTGEEAALLRFWMARSSYQSGPALRGILLDAVLRHVLDAPPPACTLLVVADPPRSGRALDRLGFPRLPGEGFAVGGRRYALYGHDWRTVPPGDWLDLLAERGPAGEALAGPAGERPAVLEREEFASAVREALKNHARPGALASSPLLRSRLVARRTGGGSGERERVAALRALLEEAAETLRQHPRDARLYRALHHTYFRPAPTQEQAARLLGLPFSTYRRHLRAGIENVTDLLWRQETHPPAKPDRK